MTWPLTVPAASASEAYPDHDQNGRERGPDERYLTNFNVHSGTVDSDHFGSPNAIEVFCDHRCDVSAQGGYTAEVVRQSIRNV